MLTTFPVEDISQPATLELIQEVIYANSTTMDGRRFASEFASKRKADVASRAAGTSSAKPVSIADVVKSQPKPTQPEWGDLDGLEHFIRRERPELWAPFYKGGDFFLEGGEVIALTS